jgi:hypothetical protein
MSRAEYFTLGIVACFPLDPESTQQYTTIVARTSPCNTRHYWKLKDLSMYCCRTTRQDPAMIELRASMEYIPG